MMRRFDCFLLLLFALSFGRSNAEPNNPSGLCKSIEIKELKDFELLRNCKIVVGHIRIVNLQLTTNSAIPASIVEEITDYLFVYRAQGLRTLQRIFPRLKIIRGQELLFDRYSLVVFENRELENLGLISLRRIQQGIIRIEYNPALCFVETVNWVYLLGNSTRQQFSFRNNRPSHQCLVCNETFADIDDSASLKKHCWNLDAYQINTVFGNLKNCPRECHINGCDDNGACCSSRCLTGCADHECELCGSFKQNGHCVDSCSFTMFQLNKRECVRESECLRNSLIPHAGVCLEKCPMHYEKNFVGGIPRCTIPCTGSYVVKSAEDLTGLQDCAIIQGSLTIELTEIKEKIVEELEKALLNLKEITGYLKIKNSPQLVSLQFLRNLHTISGNELLDTKYAFYVVNNNHLEHIWNNGQNVAVLNGRIFFHLNPRLCVDKIQALQPSLRAVHRISAADASPNSNGERVVCGSLIRTLNTTVEDFNSTAVRIKVNPMSSDDKEVLVGYAHYYKEAPRRNVTYYDGRHGCGHDNWLMDISPNRNVRHVIANLKPYTQYAFFVKTLTMTDYHTQLDAYSAIDYFQTLPSKPGPPAKVYYHSLSTTEIMIHWWPPHSPNGEIATYLIYFEQVPVDPSTKPGANYNDKDRKKPTAEICECKRNEPFYSGPPPDDENYYNKEQLVYDEALPNIVYVAKRPVNETKKDNTTSSTNSTQNPQTVTELPVVTEPGTPVTTEAQAKAVTEALTETTTKALTEDETVDEAEEPEVRKVQIVSASLRRFRRKASDYINDFMLSDSPDNKTESTEKRKLTTEEAILAYQKYREMLEAKALALQDTGIAEFPIIKYTICDQKDASVQYQLENNCRTIEQFKGTHIPGHIHQHVLYDLSPETNYRISVRACHENGECGGETAVVARTSSKTVEDFFKSSYTIGDDIIE